MLNLLLLAGRSHSLTTDPNFDVISCNNADNNLPELTLSIKQEYLDANLSWLTSQVGFLVHYTTKDCCHQKYEDFGSTCDLVWWIFDVEFSITDYLF